MGKGAFRERRYVTESARGNGLLGRDVMLLTVQRGKGVVRERRDVTENARRTGTLGSDFMLQALEGGKGSFRRDVMLNTM